MKTLSLHLRNKRTNKVTIQDLGAKTKDFKVYSDMLEHMVVLYKFSGIAEIIEREADDFTVLLRRDYENGVRK